jgi:hypothetical protein
MRSRASTKPIDKYETYREDPPAVSGPPIVSDCTIVGSYHDKPYCFDSYRGYASRTARANLGGRGAYYAGLYKRTRRDLRLAWRGSLFLASSESPQEELGRRNIGKAFLSDGANIPSALTMPTDAG